MDQNSTPTGPLARLCLVLLCFFCNPIVYGQSQDPCAQECEGATAINDASCEQVLANPGEFGKCHVCMCQEGRRRSEEARKKREREQREREKRKNTMDEYYSTVGKLNEEAQKAREAGDYDRAINLMEQAKSAVNSNEYLTEGEKESQLDHYDFKINDYESSQNKKELQYVAPSYNGDALESVKTDSSSEEDAEDSDSEEGGEDSPDGTEEGNESSSEGEEGKGESGSSSSGSEENSKRAYNPENDPEYQRIKQEEARRREEIRQNQQRYDNLKRQSQENMKDAATLSAAALLVHYYIGKLLYSINDNSYNTIYRDAAPHLRMSFGYGMSIHGLQAGYSLLERSSGGSSYENRIVHRPTIDLSFNMDHWSLHSSKLAMGFHVGISAGHGFLFETYKLRSDVGIMTRLGPVVFNTYSDFGTLKFNTWIDPTEEAEEKVVFANGKIETGIRFGSNGQDHNLLFVMQRPIQRLPDADRQMGFGGKYQGGNSNNLLFFAEFISLPVAYGDNSAPTEEEGSPFQLNIGVHNSLDWYQNSYKNNFDKRTLYEANKSKTWFITTNAKSTYGNLYPNKEAADDAYYDRLRPNLEFQLLVEKNIHVQEGWFANVGAGATMIRRFDGAWVGSSIPPPRLAEESIRGLSCGKFTVDIPLGVLYAFKPKTRNGLAPWVAFNTEMVITAGDMIDPGVMNSEVRSTFTTEVVDALNEEQKGFYTMLQFGGGFDNFYGLNKRLRWGLYYQFAPGSLYESWHYKPHGLVFSMKHSL